MLKNFKKRYIIAIVALLLISTLLVTVALVMYTSTFTPTTTKQLTLGTAINAPWTFYVNEVNQVRYLPGVLELPTLDTSSPSTNAYAFKVATDDLKVCAVQIDLTTPVDVTQFSQFDITVKACNTTEAFTTWSSVTLYDAATGNTPATLSGLTENGVAYIHQALSNTDYYLVVVTYSYTLADTTIVPTVFQYTPLPLNPQVDFTVA